MSRQLKEASKALVAAAALLWSSWSTAAVLVDNTEVLVDGSVRVVLKVNEPFIAETLSGVLLASVPILDLDIAPAYNSNVFLGGGFIDLSVSNVYSFTFKSLQNISPGPLLSLILDWDQSSVPAVQLTGTVKFEWVEFEFEDGEIIGTIPFSELRPINQTLAVPEPGAALLLGIGLVLVAALRIRRSVG